MSLRRAILWVHLAVGVAAAGVIFMLAVTGAILAYEAQFNRWALRGYRADPPAPGRAPLGLDELLARVGGERPAAAVTSVAVKRDPREPVVVRFDEGVAVHVDRFTGESLGDGDTRTRRFLRGVLSWHRWFALEGEYRLVGRTFTATANLGFLFLLVSGVWLWWPAGRSRAAWRHALWFRRGLGGRARDFNWHRVVGFWSAVPLVVIAASGATISYRWAADLVHLLAGEAPPRASSPPSEPAASGGSSFAPEPTASRVDWQALVAQAAVAVPAWRTITIRLPESSRDPVAVTVDRGTGRRPSQSEDLLFDRATGELVGRGGWPTFSRGFQMRRWLRFAHTGEVYGVIGQSVAGLVSVGAAVLVWTGLAMSRRRFFGAAGRT